MVHLAKMHDGQSVVCTDDIAESEGIPPSFLAQILHELKRTGLVTSRRGKTGGWRLTQAPGEIFLLTIVDALEPEILGQLPVVTGQSDSATTAVWERVRESGRSILGGTSLESLAVSAEPMFYI